MNDETEVITHDENQAKPEEGRQQTQEDVKATALVGVVADLVMVTTTSQRAAPDPDVQQAMVVVQQLVGQLIDLALGPEWAKENDSKVQAALQARLNALKSGVEQQVAQATAGHA